MARLEDFTKFCAEEGVDHMHQWQRDWDEMMRQARVWMARDVIERPALAGTVVCGAGAAVVVYPTLEEALAYEENPW